MVTLYQKSRVAAASCWGDGMILDTSWVLRVQDESCGLQRSMFGLRSSSHSPYSFLTGLTFYHGGPGRDH